MEGKFLKGATRRWCNGNYFYVGLEFYFHGHLKGADFIRFPLWCLEERENVECFMMRRHFNDSSWNLIKSQAKVSRNSFVEEFGRFHHSDKRHEGS